MAKTLRRRGQVLTPSATTEVTQAEEQLKEALAAEQTEEQKEVVENTQNVPNRAIFAKKAKEVPAPEEGSFIKLEDKVEMFRQMMVNSHANFAGLTRADAERILNLSEKFIIDNSKKYEFNIAGVKMKRRLVSDRWYVTELGGSRITFVPEHYESVLRVSHRDEDLVVRGIIKDDDTVEFGTYNEKGEFVFDQEMTDKYFPLFQADMDKADK